MQSFYSVIKNKEVIIAKDKKISTDYKSFKEIEKLDKEETFNDEFKTNEEEKKKEILKSYNVIGEGIIKAAQNTKEKIVEEALVKAKDIEREAYEKGYSLGLDNGHEDGYKEAYEEYIKKAKEDGEKIKEEANKVLFSANKTYENFLEEKKAEIIKLSLFMAEKIIKKELIKDDGINKIIEDVIEECKGSKSILIKCNPIHKEKISQEIDLWKNKYSIKDKIFALEDEDLEPGNAVIEKETGKSIVGIDIALEKLKEALK